MTKTKNTKRALFTSVLSMMLCVAMLIGSTFAWFTDSVTSGKNKIVAGNLDVEMEYAKLNADGSVKEWKSVQDESLFDESALWEPGYTQVVYLKVRNAGTLALKYRLAVNVANETPATNVEGKSFKLSDYLVFGQAESDTFTTYATREAAWEAAGSIKGLNNYTKDSKLAAGAEEYVALVVYMPTTVGNEANYRGTAPSIDLGVNLVATQAVSESDSFGSDYDEVAPALTYHVTPETIAEYLSGMHGSMTNAKLVLAPGNYGKLLIGLPSKHAGGDTVYTCLTGNNHSGEPLSFTDSSEFIAHLSTSDWHTTPNYLRTIDNLTIVGQEGVTVEGLLITSGHAHGGGNNVFDPVQDKEVSSAGYYMTQKITNLTFKDITFTAKCDINTSEAKTVIDGVTYNGCTFNINNLTEGNQAIRFYSENNNGNVRNLTVKDCAFNNCFQGVYMQCTNGAHISGCTFNTTKHNAIALQGSTNYKEVVIENNKFENIGDRVIRFGNIGADTQLTIKYNTATNSGDSDGEVMKAQSLAEGITYDIAYNNWGEGKKVANPELQDTSVTVTSAEALSAAISKAEDGAVIYLAAGNYDSIQFTNPSSYKVKNLTLVGDKNTVINGMSFTGYTSSSYVKIDGLTIRNLTFAKTLLLSTPEMNNVTISNCKFINDAQLNMNDKNDNLTNLTVRECEFSGDDNTTNSMTAIMLEKAENVSILNCKFTDIHFNALQAGTLNGTIRIDGNTINGTGDRVFRFVTVKGDMTISNNTIKSNGDDNGELAKSNNLCEVTLSNNTWNGLSDAEVANLLINITGK